MVHDEVDDDAQAGRASGAHELDEVAVAPEARVDAEEVGDVVAVVLVGGRIERHQPEAGHAEVGEVLDALGHAAQVAMTITVGVGESLHVGAVEHGVLPPQVAGLGELHERASSRWTAGVAVVAGGGAVGSSCGRTLSPKASMKRDCSLPTKCR